MKLREIAELASRQRRWGKQVEQLYQEHYRALHGYLVLSGSELALQEKRMTHATS
jgi:hypothetical protein